MSIDSDISVEILGFSVDSKNSSLLQCSFDDQSRVAMGSSNAPHGIQTTDDTLLTLLRNDRNSSQLLELLGLKWPNGTSSFLLSKIWISHIRLSILLAIGNGFYQLTRDGTNAVATIKSDDYGVELHQYWIVRSIVDGILLLQILVFLPVVVHNKSRLQSSFWDHNPKGSLSYFNGAVPISKRFLGVEFFIFMICFIFAIIINCNFAGALSLDSNLYYFIVSYPVIYIHSISVFFTLADTKSCQEMISELRLKCKSQTLTLDEFKLARDNILKQANYCRWSLATSIASATILALCITIYLLLEPVFYASIFEAELTIVICCLYLSRELTFFYWILPAIVEVNDLGVGLLDDLAEHPWEESKDSNRINVYMACSNKPIAYPVLGIRLTRTVLFVNAGGLGISLLTAILNQIAHIS